MAKDEEEYKRGREGRWEVEREEKMEEEKSIGRKGRERRWEE
jgi:hypothetical protein